MSLFLSSFVIVFQIFGVVESLNILWGRHKWIISFMVSKLKKLCSQDLGTGLIKYPIPLNLFLKTFLKNGNDLFNSSPLYLQFTRRTLIGSIKPEIFPCYYFTFLHYFLYSVQCLTQYLLSKCLLNIMYAYILLNFSTLFLAIPAAFVF